MSRDDRLTDIACRVVRQTERAYCVTDDDAREIWLPKSQVDYDPDTGTMTMPVRLAQEKELI